MCIWDAVLDLQCNVLHWELPVPGGCEVRRCSGAFQCSQGYLLCFALTQALQKSGASVVLNSNVSWLDIYFYSPDVTVDWKPLVSCFYLRGNKFHVENTILYLILGFFCCCCFEVFFLEGTSSQLVSYPLVQEFLFERWKLHGVFLGVSCARPEADLMIFMVPFQLSGFYEILKSLQAFFQWSFFDHFAPFFISSLGLTFHSMLYLSQCDLILFPWKPYVLFMFQWLRNKWESGQFWGLQFAFCLTPVLSSAEVCEPW